MKKKVIAALLAATMVLGMTACGDNGGQSSASGTGGSESSAEKSSGASDAGEESSAAEGEQTGGEEASGGADVDTSEHVVINYMTTGDRPSGDAETRLNEMLTQLNAILTEKVNAELEIYYIPWTDYLSNYNLTLAKMDGSVDLVGTASDWLDAWPNAKNGAFLELSEDMLKTYAPQTWASVPAENWEVCK